MRGMLRQPRIEYAGAIYHVMNRGDWREDIFRDDADRERFLATLGEACAKTSWQVHAYCLSRNYSVEVGSAGVSPAAFGVSPKASGTCNNPLNGYLSLREVQSAGRRLGATRTVALP
jgi:hypothetical protein